MSWMSWFSSWFLSSICPGLSNNQQWHVKSMNPVEVDGVFGFSTMYDQWSSLAVAASKSSESSKQRQYIDCRTDSELMRLHKGQDLVWYWRFKSRRLRIWETTNKGTLVSPGLLSYLNTKRMTFLSLLDCVQCDLKGVVFVSQKVLLCFDLLSEYWVKL